MKISFLIPLLILCSGVLIAQDKSSGKTSHISDTKQNESTSGSPVKSLEKNEFDAYQNGEPMGLTRPAEINNYPAPSRVLSLEKQLKLTAAQKAKLVSIDKDLLFKAKEMGRFIIQNEKKLNDLFLSGKIDEGSLIYFTNQFGLYQGELRNAHLQAHLKTKRLLTPDQLKKISKLP